MTSASEDRYLVQESLHRRFVVVGAGAVAHSKRIRRCFQNSPYGVVVSSIAPQPEAVLDVCISHLPCVLIIDSDSVLKMDPVLFARKIEYGSLVPVLALVKRESLAQCEALLRMGCMGFLQPEAPPWRLRRAVDAVTSGELWAPRLLVSRICRDFLTANDPRKLTGREEDILALLAEDRKNREIAATLHISRDTVRWHMRTIYSKLGIHDRQSAVNYANARKLGPRQSRPVNSDHSLAV